jgi:hypothetical protein
MPRITDEQLAAMTAAERADLQCRIAVMNAPDVDTRTAEHRRHRFVALCTFASAALVPWLVLLSITLPPRYVAARWGATWVGFDIALIVCMSLTAWLAWQRRQALILAAVVTGTLLICDAWFDVLTANSTVDLISSLAAAALLELPMAALLFALAHRLFSVVFRLAYMCTGVAGPDRPLHQVPLLTVRRA